MKPCNYHFANSIFHPSYPLTVFVTFVVWHFCNGRIDFVKFIWSPPSHSFSIVWWLNNNTGCTILLNNNPSVLCVNAIDICQWLVKQTQKQPPLNNASPRIIYFMFFYVLLSKSGRLNALKLEFASSSFSAPCWIWANISSHLCAKLGCRVGWSKTIWDENSTGETNHKCDLSLLAVEGSLVLMFVFNCLI